LATQQIIAIGGHVLVPEDATHKIERYMLDATGKAKPRVCFVPTASGESLDYITRYFETYGKFGVECEVLRFFRRTPDDLRAFVSRFDLIHIGGGNTRSMLAVWKHWGFDAVLREAWQNGTVLCGSSAGAICWFEEGLTDSVDTALRPMPCLGFLPGSNCPHYDGEAERRPAYQRLVGNGEMKPGIACDDGAAAHFVGTTFHRAISARENARVYLVERDGERARETALDVVKL